MIDAVKDMIIEVQYKINGKALKVQRVAKGYKRKQISQTCGVAECRLKEIESHKMVVIDEFEFVRLGEYFTLEKNEMYRVDGLKLLILRGQSGLTRFEFAKKCNMSDKKLWLAERGGTEITAVEMRRIEYVVQCHVKQ